MAAFVPLFAAQLLRLHQTDPSSWIALDYAGRIGMLGVLAVIPAARAVAFRREPRLIAWWEAIAWIIGLVLVDRAVGVRVRFAIDAAIPGTRLGLYPAPHGWLYAVDLVFGLALVAVSEELFFRRCARSVLRQWLGDGVGMVIATSFLFALFHWWTGLGNMAEALIFGLCAMHLYRRAGSLWPVAVAHYLVDILSFA